MDDLDMHDIENNHLDEENHQFGSNDLDILHNEENQSETQVLVIQRFRIMMKINWKSKFKVTMLQHNMALANNSLELMVLSFGFQSGGLPNTSTLDTISVDHNKQLRNSNCKRTNCKAFVAFKVIPDSSEVYLWRFEQQHNLKLINQDCMHLSRAKRQLDVVDQAFIHKLSSAKVGETTTYRLMCVIKGGCEFVGGLEIDWKNFTMDINCHSGGTDANLLITKL
ncbi:unnamed protein product [Lactuca virosa]|uniref:Protein FAR1-RELATED SEQUENCE n=1 Tax=Lactuca virosa TaxID=75947 RepID=A0AAU9N486_9ASTR|nr:unnamed protein product [Lactuca virosa]